jgi:RecB family exonuclease
MSDLNSVYGVTALTTWDTCPKKWYFDQVERLRGDKPTESMLVGTLVHAALEGYFNFGRDTSVGFGLLQEAADQMENSIQPYMIDTLNAAYDKASSIFYNYVSFGDRLDIENVIGTEIPVEITINDVRLRGKLDLVYIAKNGDLVLVDHKVKANPDHADSWLLAFDHQVLTYGMMLYQYYGRLPDRIIHNVLKNKVGKPVKTLLDGTVSRAKAELDKTTLSILADQLDLLDPHYAEAVDYVRERQYDNFFAVDVTTPTEETFEIFAKNLCDKITVMKEMVKTKTVYRNASVYNCRYCLYRQICEREATGRDASGLRGNYTYTPV